LELDILNASHAGSPADADESSTADADAASPADGDKDFTDDTKSEDALMLTRRASMDNLLGKFSFRLYS